jgi:acyl-coenzyme A thioesterase PaaI-like protein
VHDVDLNRLVRCEASFLRRGRSLSFLQSAVTDAGGDLIAHATATWTLLEKKPREKIGCE